MGHQCPTIHFITSLERNEASRVDMQVMERTMRDDIFMCCSSDMCLSELALPHTARHNFSASFNRGIRFGEHIRYPTSVWGCAVGRIRKYLWVRMNLVCWLVRGRSPMIRYSGQVASKDLWIGTMVGIVHIPIGATSVVMTTIISNAYQVINKSPVSGWTYYTSAK